MSSIRSTPKKPAPAGQEDGPSFSEIENPPAVRISGGALEDGKRYFVMQGSRNELHEMSYDGKGDMFIPTGKRSGYALLAKNAPKVWEQDEHGELKPVKIPNERVFIKKVTQ